MEKETENLMERYSAGAGETVDVLDGIITKEELWEEIAARQGEIFYTAKGLPFTYSVRGGEIFVDRRKKSITRATFEQAYQKIQEDTEHRITGPKSLNCFGAPYVWAVFKVLKLV